MLHLLKIYLLLPQPLPPSPPLINLLHRHTRHQRHTLKDVQAPILHTHPIAAWITTIIGPDYSGDRALRPKSPH